jgi:transcriptional regulator with XRE-family HTH domain
MTSGGPLSCSPTLVGIPSTVESLTMFANVANMATVATLGQVIRERRQQLRLTVRGFAAQIGVQPPFVTDIEADRRRPSPEVMQRIALTLGLELSELQKLDPRISPEVKEWMEEEPRVSSLLRRMRESPDRGALLDRVEKVIEGEDGDTGEAD